MNKLKKGFTLIELLITIAIIAILATVVLGSVNTSRAKGNRAAAIKTVRSVLPEIMICINDNGYTTNTAPASGNPICATNASPATTAISGHTAVWPDVSKLGWTYDLPSGSINGVSTPNYIFSISKSGQNPITCKLAENACS